jgi:predicted 2-oxoglutarate/Fe(II)-dependent dioxygenase YbiX
MVRADRREALPEARLEELGVFVRPTFFDKAECASARAAMDRGRVEAAEIYVGGYVLDEGVRRTFDVAVHARTVRAVERAFADVRPDVSCFFGETVSAAEGPGFLRYPTGGFYRAHRDHLDEPGQEFSRRISLVLFLTDADGGAGDGRCEGGSLRLYGVVDPAQATVPLDISPVAGTLIAFRSHVLHEVLPVTGGVRDAIVDWFY